MIAGLVATGLLAAGLLTIGPGPAAAADSSWSTVGPGGGGAFNSPCLTDTAWVVGSDLGGLSWSADQGASWRQIGASAGLTDTHVSTTVCLADGRVVVGTQSGLYVVDAGGASAVPATITDGSTPYVAALVQSADPSVLYAAVHPTWDALDPSLLRSSDGGETWVPMPGAGLPALRRVVALRAHPVDADAVVVVTGNGRFQPEDHPGALPREAWLTTDGGGTFARLDPAQGGVVDVVYSGDPDRSDEMFLTSRTTGLWRSDDAGGTWSHLADRTGVFLPSPVVGRLRLMDAERATWDRPGAGVWVSDAAGAAGTWTHLSDLADWDAGWSGRIATWGVEPSYQGSLQTSAVGGDVVLWTDSQLVYASTDGGGSFHQVVSRQRGHGRWVTRGIDNAVPAAVAPSAARQGLVYVGYLDLGLWRSTDGGDSWRALRPRGVTSDWGGGRLGGNSLTVLADPVRRDTVWASFGGDLGEAGGTRLLRSTDAGTHWTRSSGLPSGVRQISGLSLSPRSPAGRRTLHVVADHDVYRSTDDGRAWRRAFAGCRGCEQTWTARGHVYAGGWGGLWRAAKRDTWTRVRLPGVSWASAADGPCRFHESCYRGVADVAAAGGAVWTAVTGRGFLRSTDGGVTWTLAKRDDYARSVSGIGGSVITGSSSAFDSGGWDAAHPSRGVQVSATGGLGGWTSLNGGLGYPFAVQVRVDRADGSWWALSPGQGVVRLR